MKTRLVSMSLVLTCVLVLLLGAACGEEAAENRAPVIANVSGNPSSVIPGGSSRITCDASDPDDDRLLYSWSASGGSISGGNDVVTWVAPETTGTYSISVTVSDDKGGSASGSYSVDVVTEGSINRAPIITSLRAELLSVPPQRKTVVTCEASDPDGDPITYEWWAQEGRIEGTGGTVNYVAPLWEGEWEVSVHVRDNRLGNAERSIMITVASNEPPEIARVRAEPRTILIDGTTTITCEASDPDGDSLIYSWSAAEGSISGSGNVVTWTAPGRAGYFEIEVTISDGRGGTDSGSETVQTKGLKVVTPLTPVTAESGSIRSDSNIITLWTVGDDSVNNSLRTFLSFDISGITEVEEFRSAVLNVGTLEKNGTPWEDLGDLLIDEVEYGTRALQDGDYDLAGTRLERLASEPTAEIDLTQLIYRAVRDGEIRFQIRLYFSVETDNDNLSDNIKTKTASLTVTYVKSTD